jgi:putative FmdB family regulatory protein
MPTYNYKCNNCGNYYEEIHSIKVVTKGCPHCSSTEVEKTVARVSTRVDRRVENALDMYEKQAVKDQQRFLKDDNFAANITGADDPNHQSKLKKAMQEAYEKNERSLRGLKQRTRNQ